MMAVQLVGQKALKLADLKAQQWALPTAGQSADTMAGQLVAMVLQSADLKADSLARKMAGQ